MRNLFVADLTDTELKISNKINDNLDLVVGMSISELASYCEVSPSKITKYSKKIGYSGFKELQYALKNAHDNEERDPTTSVEYQQQKINEFFKNFDSKKLVEVMNYIENAEKIYFYGRGPSLKVAEYYVPRLRVATNKNVISNYDEYLFDTDLLKDEENKLMIILTISGKTKEVHEVLRVCKMRNIPTIVISGYVSDTLKKEADLYINLLPKKEFYDRRIIRGRTLFYIYLEILTQEFMGKYSM